MIQSYRMARGLALSGLMLTLTACGVASENSETAAEAPAPTCGVTPACDLAPILGKAQGFFTAKPKGDAWHFGKDFFLNETEDQWIIAKFQYGSYLFRSPLVHEQVEIQLSRGCGSAWETLGKVLTTTKGEHPAVLQYEDEGGMVFFKIPEDKRLGLGRHRIRLVVSGDQSATDLFLEVLPQGSSLFVSDVDGTLTTSELIEGVASVFGTLPPAHPGAATLFQGLASKGYRPIYLTARSSNLVARTRGFVTNKKFPEGVVMTTEASTFGLSGDKAVDYKTEILQGLEDRGFKVAYGFGNTKVDAEAFANVNIPDSQKYFFNFKDYSAFGGGASFKDYAGLTAVQGAVNLCL